ncbi:MAG TPA: glycosyltransferase, partial [Saprospiraceae bacterium]|nr:glycosyltransferase [Saprospiraceae bacterium]
LFYAEFNIRLFLFLLFKKIDVLYAVDLDTIAVGGMVKIFRRIALIFDAHEYFEETPEVYNRPFVKFIWSCIGNTFVPRADRYITVNESLALILGRLYNRQFEVIYNAPVYSEIIDNEHTNCKKPYILYQGVLNKGRGISETIDAMEMIKGVDLYLVGEGDLSSELREKASKSKAHNRIVFLGWLSPNDMKNYTLGATLGINLLDGTCKNYYYSLANKFFDYMHQGIPSVNMDFPEYRVIINQYDVGVLVQELTPKAISTGINELLEDQDRLQEMHLNCKKASQKFNWQNEEQKLSNLFKSLID